METVTIDKKDSRHFDLRTNNTFITLNTRGIYFSKGASILINAPCKISFRIEQDKMLMVTGEENGLDLSLYKTCGFIISDRSIVNRFIELTKLELGTRLYLKSIGDNKQFLLTTI